MHNPFFSRRLSCGIVILNRRAELLLCHVTGHDHWDLPKGGMHADESPLQAALRETREETGLAFDAGELLELGRFAYRPKKDLHLFAALSTRVDASRLRCESHFSQLGTGRLLPEMDGFGWFAFARVPTLVTPKMAAVLCTRLDLRELQAQLLAGRTLTAAPEQESLLLPRSAVLAA
jgi:8-oxo-dGTP pyrophosphatase MutT (NUDIX family)